MTTPRRPPGRYDERRALPRPVLVAGAVAGGAVLLLGSYLAYDRFSGQRVAVGTLGYEVVDDASVRVRFEVRKGLQDTVSCTLHALDRDQAEVGEVTVTVGPTERERTTSTATVPTTARATTAEAVGCTLVTP